MTNKKILYRRVAMEDIPPFMRAFREYYTETQEGSLTDEFLDNLIVGLVSLIKSPQALILGAFSGKKVAGFTMVVPQPSLDGARWCLIDPFYVCKEYRNHDIGLKMWEIINEWAKANEVKKIIAIEGADDNMWSRKKRVLGFKPYRKLLIKEV